MNSPAFVTSFTGKTLPSSNNNVLSGFNTPRCSMGDSKAPVIKVRKTAIERQNSVSIELETIDLPLGAADGIRSNSALVATLKGNKPAVLPSTTSKPTCPDGISPVDFYFPKETRNEAPYVTLKDDNSISVEYLPVTKTVSNVPSTSVSDIPFWKQPKPYKWTSSSSSSSSSTETEVISTASFEKYFSSDIRNSAPFINIREPAKCLFNENPYIEVGSEFVKFNQQLNKLVELPSDADDVSYLKAAATICTYYPEYRINKAPIIEITGPEQSVQVSMDVIEGSESEAKQISTQYEC